MTIFHYETFESTLNFLDSKGIANEKLTRSIQSWTKTLGDDLLSNEPMGLIST